MKHYNHFTLKKQKIIKATREKRPLKYKGTKTTIIADLSFETMQVRSSGIFSRMKDKNCNP